MKDSLPKDVVLFASEEGCDLYKSLRNDERYSEYRKSLEDAYKCCKKILDKDFHKKFPKETGNRIPELYVAYALLENTKLSEITVSNGGTKKQGGPDFRVEYSPTLGRRRIFVECVCANDQTKDQVEAECKKWKEPLLNAKGEIIGWIKCQRGIGGEKIPRISSVIKDKAEKIQKYKSKGIMEDNDIKALVVGINSKKNRNIFEKLDFEKVIAFRAIGTWVSERGLELSVEKDTGRTFKKNGKDMRLEEDSLTRFDVIVFVDLFWSVEDLKNRKNWGNPFSYRVYAIKPLDAPLKETIEKIFNTKVIEINKRYVYVRGKLTE